MPNLKIDEEAAEALGRLLYAYGEPSGLASRANITAVRRDRLRDALGHAGVDVPVHTAGVLADGMASGQLIVTDTYLYLVNDGSLGVKATCSCRSGKGGCTLSLISNRGILCFPSENSTCKSCGFTVGLTVAAISTVARKPAQLGAQFAHGLSQAYLEAISELSRLSYPIVDRLNMHEQTERCSSAAGRKALLGLSLPLLTLADGLDHLLADTGSGFSAPANLMRARSATTPTQPPAVSPTPSPPVRSRSRRTAGP